MRDYIVPKIGERKMNNKAFAISVAFIVVLCLGYLAPVYAASGPKTAHIEIHIYLNPDATNADMEKGVLDINDWPLTKEWIDKWALMPDKLQLRDYVELGMMEVDINNQRWPTGCPDHKFYDATDLKCLRAEMFRKGVACLLDREAIVTEVLKGYAYLLDVPVPPPQSAYMDMPLYQSLGLIYRYNETRAANFFNAAGFTMGGDGWRIDPYTGVKMAPLKYYIRMDDPNRMRAGQMHVAALQAMGIPVNAIITERTVCYKNVMVLYDYNLYTGGWSLSSIPDTYHDLYSSFTYYGPSIGWSTNYPGFCNHEFDSWALKVKYPADLTEAQTAAKKCGELFLEHCAIIPMWSMAAVKAYKTGWTGVVNNAFFGIDNGYSFLNMYKAGDDTIDYGFKSDIEQLNIVTSEWLWDINVLGLMYDSMIGTNPFNLAPTEWFLATACAVTTWDSGVDPEATHMVWTINTNALWHDGNNVTVDDIKFSIEFNKVCGSGVSWNYPLVSDVYDVSVAGNQVTVRMKHGSAWAFQWIGGLPIIQKSIWEKIQDGTGKVWTDSGWNSMVVRQYDPVTADKDSSGTMDIFEDGTGPWKFVSYSMGNYVRLDANLNYYRTQDDIAGRLQNMFHYGAGDCDESGTVNIVDMGMYQLAFGFTGNPSDPPHMTPPYYPGYNSACDLNKDGIVNIDDMGVAGMNYGGTMG